MEGRVKSFYPHTRYGFIRVKKTEKMPKDLDIFVHGSQILKPNPLHGRKSLRKDEYVEFIMARPEQGTEGNTLQAMNVTGPNGKPVRGLGNTMVRPELRRPGMD